MMLVRTKMTDTSGVLLDLMPLLDAVRAAKFMAGIFERVSFIRCLHGALGADGEPVIVVVVKRPVTDMERGCLPTAVNHIALDIRVESCRRRHQ